MVSLRLLLPILEQARLTPPLSSNLDFHVTTPPKLTRAQYEDYLDHRSTIKQIYLDFLEGKPVTTTTGNLHPVPSLG